MSGTGMSGMGKVGRIAAVALLGVGAAALGGCGKRGLLEQPAPLFGERAQAQYEAQQEQKAQDAADARALKAASRNKPAADKDDDGPLTTRDIKAPEQQNVPASRQPIDGAPDPLGAPPSLRPPG